MGGPFFLLFGIVSRCLQSMGEDHFSKQCVKLRNWIPLFLGCFFGDRVVCKKKKGNGHSGKKKISRESLTMRKKRVSCMYIYRFVGYLLTGITIYNPLIYELSSKENLLDSLQFFFPFSPITWTRSIVGTKLYPPYFSKIESNDFFTRVSTKEKLGKSIEDDSFRGIILAKSLETPNLEIGPSTLHIEQDEEEGRVEMPRILSLRSSFRREDLTKRFHDRPAVPSEGSPDA